VPASRWLICGLVPADAAGGLSAATFSGSQIIRSAGLHSRTEQITSRSSSRIDTGVVVHHRDIFRR